VILTGLELVDLSLPNQHAGSLHRQFDVDGPCPIREAIAHSDLSIGMVHLAADIREFSEMRLDPDLAETRRIAVDAQHRPVEFDVRAASPGMTIRTGKIDIG